ncbi:sulfur carrier protein ThiS [Jatrophihabitans sp.]|uniref:sulfur carrier protein ThiS n=1 Tax=Jatrophihabitans sp. TaxID=1932789 RepID=UPI0030C6BB27|nr:thiS [Jatrophihabitans sp.]
MIVTINGEDRDIADGSTVAALIDDLLGSSRGSAAVVDGDVVPRSEWDSLVLRAGQEIELIVAVQGG